MGNNKFTKPPLTQKEIEKRAEDFVGLAETQKGKGQNEAHKKEPTKSLYLRAPQGYWRDIQEIMALTGLSMNAICLELLRPAIKKKLRELKED